MVLLFYGSFGISSSLSNSVALRHEGKTKYKLTAKIGQIQRMFCVVSRLASEAIRHHGTKLMMTAEIMANLSLLVILFQCLKPRIVRRNTQKPAISIAERLDFGRNIRSATQSRARKTGRTTAAMTGANQRSRLCRIGSIAT